MGNMVTNVYVKFNYDQLHTNKALGNLWKYDSNKNKNNVCSTWNSPASRHQIIGIEAQSTLGGKTFLPENYVSEINKMPKI